MAGEIQKATSQGQLLKVRERERENSLTGHYIIKPIFLWKKNPLHGKQLDKQKAAKRNPEI